MFVLVAEGQQVVAAADPGGRVRQLEVRVDGVLTRVDAWFVRMEVGVKKFADDSKWDVYQKGPSETDATMQAQVIRDLIAQKVDAIDVGYPIVADHPRRGPVMV